MLNVTIKLDVTNCVNTYKYFSVPCITNMCSLSLVLTCFLVICSSSGRNLEGAIGFPEKEENTKIKNKENREPVYLPSMCPENQLFYPGDQKDDWICDCRPSHLYHPTTDKCWPAYRQGPCGEKQYLVLPANTYIPACVSNPCLMDTFVHWNGTCQKLGLATPCKHLLPNDVELGVNAITLQIDCVKNSESQFLTPSELPPAAKRQKKQKR